MSASADDIERVAIGDHVWRVLRRSGRAVPGMRPLLICNDFAANFEILDEFGDGFDRPTILFDSPGLIDGQRGRPERMRALASSVMALLEALAVSSVDVLGIGWGGLLAQQIARDHAARLGRLVLVATSAGQTMLPGRLAHVRRLARRRGLQGLVVDGHEARLLFGGRRDSECTAVARALARAVVPSTTGMAAQLYAVAGFSSLAWAHRIKVPTLVLAGDDDRIVPLANARLLAMLLARAELSVLHGAGHWLVIERQAEATRRIEAFLALGDR